MCHTPLCIVGTYPGLADRWVDPVCLSGVVTMSHPQAQRGVGVRLSDPAGSGVGCHRKGPCRAGLLLHRTRRDSGSLDRLWPGRHRRPQRRGSGDRGADAGAVRLPACIPWPPRGWQQLGVADLTDANIKSATRLGAPFKVYAGEVSPFRVEVAKRIATRQAAAGQLGGRVSLCGTSGAGPYRGGAGVLPSRAWPRSDRCPRDRRHHRQAVASAHPDRCRL